MNAETENPCLREYNKDHCWQYDIRLRNREDDLKAAGLTEDAAQALRVSDFVFRPLNNHEERAEAVAFIKRHEWLGNISLYTTHWFGAYYHDPHQGLVGKDIMAGVILMNQPNAFCKLLGEDTRKIERLVSRGACVSWSPKNLASSFLMWCCGWMVKNTQYRLFTAYSDPTAKELGTIYQACNWNYLGQESGATAKYINPYNGKAVSDRFFRCRSAYKKYAIDLGIKWERDWNVGDKIFWDKMPSEVETKLRAYSKKMQSESQKIQMPSKHKYAFVLGATKAETKKLRREFEERNPPKAYPKERGK